MSEELKTKIKQTLKQYWGYDSFRSIQEDVILSVLSKKDTLALANTGMGKSILYMVPALNLEGTTLVISPLKALQKDQVDDLVSLGVPVAYLNSDVGVRARKKLLKQLENNEIKLLYIAPESVFSDSFKEFKDLLKVPLISIDESHCCSSWSDFRPNYKRIHELREIFPNASMLAVTATADDKIIKDIETHVGLTSDYNCFRTSFDRPNLHYFIKYPTKPISQHIIDVIKEKGKDTYGILYFNTRKEAEEVSKFLTMVGYPTLFYHAGMKKKEKEQAQLDFKSGVYKRICATTAFGMGIDMPKVRYVINGGPPHSYEDLVQQWGRASRDGEHADCYLFYTKESLNKSIWLLNQTTKNPQRLKIKVQKLREFHDFCRDTEICRRKSILKYFGEKYNKTNCNSCDVCLRK